MSATAKSDLIRSFQSSNITAPLNNTETGGWVAKASLILYDPTGTINDKKNLILKLDEILNSFDAATGGIIYKGTIQASAGSITLPSDAKVGWMYTITASSDYGSYGSEVGSIIYPLGSTTNINTSGPYLFGDSVIVTEIGSGGVQKVAIIQGNTKLLNYDKILEYTPNSTDTNGAPVIFNISNGTYKAKTPDKLFQTSDSTNVFGANSVSTISANDTQTIKIPKVTTDNYGRIKGIEEASISISTGNVTTLATSIPLSNQSNETAATPLAVANYLSNRGVTFTASGFSEGQPVVGVGSEELVTGKNTVFSANVTKGITADTTISAGSSNVTFKVPKVTADKWGFVTGLEDKTVTVSVPTVRNQQQYNASATNTFMADATDTNKNYDASWLAVQKYVKILLGLPEAYSWGTDSGDNANVWARINKLYSNNYTSDSNLGTTEIAAAFTGAGYPAP